MWSGVRQQLSLMTLLVFIVVTISVTLLPASANSVPQRTGGSIATFDEALIGQVRRLNPLFTGLNPVDADITSFIFNGLMQVNEYGEPVPSLAAEMPVVSFDGLEYVVRLRDDVLWHDGVPFTAADVVYTMSLLADPEFPGPIALGAFWRTVETEMLGDHLVRFRLAQPLGSFMEALRVGILPVHALEGTTAAQIASHPFNIDPIGTGPYQLEALRSDGTQIQQVDLRRAPVYGPRSESEQISSIDRIRFHLFADFQAVVEAMEAGVVDGYATDDANERRTLFALDEDWLSYTATLPEMGMLLFNWTRDEVAFFRDQRIRQALAIGIGRTAPVERFLSNAAIRLDGPLPPGTWASVPLDFGGAYPWPDSDPSIARDLLARAGVRPPEDDPEGPLLRFSLLAPDNAALTGIASDLATQWSQYGIDVSVDAQPLSEYRMRLQSGDFDMALTELSLVGSADPDVYAFWHQGQYPDGLNYGGVNDTVISEQLERGRSDFSGTNRQIHYADFQRAFMERAIAIPLYVRLYTYFVANEVNDVQLGYIASRPDRFQTFSSWQITSQ